MSWTPYRGEDYLDFPALLRQCEALAAAHPALVGLTAVGESRHGRPLLLLTIGSGRDVDDRPAFWLDGGTHAAEWAGVMSALYSACRWVEGAAGGDPATADWFSRNTAYVMPCISPDGFQALMEGRAFLRSTLRPPPPGTVRSGFQARDMDGDGRIRWMRWRHPAGPWVDDPEHPGLPRRRGLSDDPGAAWFLGQEGDFVNWDGIRWTGAPREFGLDLNRNFPGSWAPFGMFGMDGGEFPMSEPESRAVVETFAARRRVGAAVTNHTYTGCLLTQPYRQDSPLDDADIRLMEALAKQAVEGTGYRSFRTCPDFMYDPKQAIVGVWADTMSTVFGVPGYTLELWDPTGHAGVKNDKPIEFFMNPDPERTSALLSKFREDPASWRSWQPFDHPQLGPVEIGGLDYMRTVRNPPVAELAAECARGHAVADTIRRALPETLAELRVAPAGDGVRAVTLVLENRGYLPTSGLALAEKKGLVPFPSARLDPGEGVALLQGTPEQTMHHLDGWGTQQLSAAASPLYTALPDRGHRAVARWLVRGEGPLTIRWDAGRGGRGVVSTDGA